MSRPVSEARKGTFSGNLLFRNLWIYPLICIHQKWTVLLIMVVRSQLASSLPSSGPPSAVPQSVLDGVIPLCLDALIPCKSQQTQSIQILRVLGTLLLDNGTSLVKMHPLLLSTLVPMSQSPDPELRRLAITCLANLCSKTGAKFVALHKEVLDVALANMGHADLKVCFSMRPRLLVY